MYILPNKYQNPCFNDSGADLPKRKTDRQTYANASRDSATIIRLVKQVVKVHKTEAILRTGDINLCNEVNVLLKLRRRICAVAK